MDKARYGNLFANQTVRDPEGRETFDDVLAWLGTLPDQNHDDMVAVDASEVPVEFGYGLACRDEPFDIAIATAQIAAMFKSDLQSYLASRNRTIYWRDGFEWDYWRDGIIVSYSDDGPDMDNIADKRCAKDKRFVLVKCYARLCKSDKEFKKREDKPLTFMSLGDFNATMGN